MTLRRHTKKSLSLLLTFVLLLSLLTGLGMQASAAELPVCTADGTMTELAGGTKTAAGTYSIGSAAELRALSTWVNAGNTGEGFTFCLTADVDLGGESSPWTPIGQLGTADGAQSYVFSGVFDGQGHSVTGLWVGGEAYASGSGAFNEANGLFGVSAGTVRNVAVDAEIHTYRCGAAVVGHNQGTILNCFASGSISANGGGGQRGSGGVAGENSGTVQACISIATVYNDYRRAGGLVGYNQAEGTVADSFFAGYASSANETYSGGVAATNSGTITNCYWLEGSCKDNVGYYQEAEGATGTFGTDGLLTGSTATLLSVLPDGFIAPAKGNYPVLYWQSGYEWADISQFQTLKK